MNVCTCTKDKRKQKEILFLLLCCIIGFTLRFYTFDTKSLWMDEVYTFNDSRDDLNGQIKFYEANPTYLHPPLFFLLTHFFYPFEKPERDLRILPLIFGTLSIPMIYLLARQFSPAIALPCALSLTFMTYHISLSQDGRSYTLIMFLGMMSLYFFMKHLQTSQNKYLFVVAFFFSILFYTSYSSIPFIALSQILWFFRTSEELKKPTRSSLLILNGLILLFSLPWILFVGLNYKRQSMMDPSQGDDPMSFGNILYGIFHDWAPLGPLMIASGLVLVLSLILSRCRKNATVLLLAFLIPVGGLYLFCKLLNLSHFITSKYFINFLPLFLISIYSSLSEIEDKFEKLKRFIRLEHIFILLFIISNLVLLPLYYRSEKQDFRRLANHIREQVRGGDKIIVGTLAYFPGILHYLGVLPKGRHYIYSVQRVSEKEIEYKFFLSNEKDDKLILSHSKTFWRQYAAEGNRLWIVVDKMTAKEIIRNTPSILKGYFDGSFANVERFPIDASLCLLLWDPKSPNEKGIDMPIE